MAGLTKPATYALLDREEEMSNAVSYLRRLTPIDVQSLIYWRFWDLYKKSEDNTRILAGMKKSGVGRRG